MIDRMNGEALNVTRIWCILWLSPCLVVVSSDAVYSFFNVPFLFFFFLLTRERFRQKCCLIGDGNMTRVRWGLMWVWWAYYGRMIEKNPLLARKHATPSKNVGLFLVVQVIKANIDWRPLSTTCHTWPLPSFNLSAERFSKKRIRRRSNQKVGS